MSVSLEAVSQPSFRHLGSISIIGRSITSDKLGNCYVVSDKQDVFKVSSKGEVLHSYSNISLGPITYVGATNPLKILVFYKDYSTIVILDNTLSQTSRINLFELGNYNVSAACVALDNNIWIYDNVIFKLRKFDERLNIVAESEDLNVQLGFPVNARYIYEKDNYLYLNDPDTAIFVFDSYGTFYKTIPLKVTDNFQKVQDQLVYFEDGSMMTYHLLTFETGKIKLPVGDAIQASIEKDRLFLLRKNQLDVYSH